MRCAHNNGGVWGEKGPTAGPRSQEIAFETPSVTLVILPNCRMLYSILLNLDENHLDSYEGINYRIDYKSHN